MRRSRTLTRPCLVAVVALALLATGCGSGSGEEGGTFVPGATSASGEGSGGSASTAPASGGGTASRDKPLAERVFRVDPAPTTTAQRDALQALQRYLDSVVVAFATNDVSGSGMRRYASAGVYQTAQRQVADQVKGGYVVYGPYTFTISPSEVRPPIAVMSVCVNESRTRRHDVKTDATGRPNDNPYVRLQYSLTFQPGKGWLVTGSNGDDVPSCPS